MPARRNGLAPACLNFCMFVSVPRAVIAMVSRKVSMYSMTPFSGMSLTVGASKRYCRREFTQIMPMKPKANHGIVILLFSLCPSAVAFLRPASAKLIMTSTGASIITRIIFVIVAVPAMPRLSVGSMALPAPATCATSCSVLPV